MITTTKKPKNSLNRLKRPFLLSLVFLSACALKPANGGKKNPPAFNPSSGNSSTFDFKTNCGLEDNAAENAVVFAQNLRSQNFVVDGGVGAMKAHVEADASLEISSTASSGRQKITVNIKKITDQSANPTNMTKLVTLIGARIAAKSRAGTMISNALPQKDWLKLTDGSNPEYKDLLCVLLGQGTSQKEEKPGKLYRFTPALISSINPKASPEQIKKEIGDGRKFTIRAAVVNSANNREESSSNGTVSVSSVSPHFSATDPLTKQTVTIDADAAYQVVSNFPSTKNDFEEFSRKVTFFMNHKEKKFSAIVQENLPSPGADNLGPNQIVMLPQ